jgi:hypothetical protein
VTPAELARELRRVARGVDDALLAARLVDAADALETRAAGPPRRGEAVASDAETRALEALAGAGVDPGSLSPRQRSDVAARLRRVVDALPAAGGANRAVVRDLTALAELLERGV